MKFCLVTRCRWEIVLASFAGLASFTVLAKPAHAQLISGSTTRWNAILYGGNGVADPSNDQQTGQRDSDIVGTTAVPSAYMAFDPASAGSLTDGTLYFRLRLAEDSQSAGYDGFVWVGIDANSDGAIDLFAGVNRQGNNSETVLRNPGTGSNTSPNTTSIDTANLASSPYAHTASNYNWAAVGAANYTGSNFDIDGGGQTDFFMSFGVPFQDIVTNLNTTGSGRPAAISINQNTNLRFVIATSQQGNSINQDINGGSIPINSTTTYTSLGVISDTGTMTSQITIPEAGTFGLLTLGGVSLGCLASRRKLPSRLRYRKLLKEVVG
jgi:hypothetical protein